MEYYQEATDEARTTLEAAQAALAEAEEGLAAAEAAQEAAEAEAAAEAENSTESESSSDDGFARNLQLKEIPEAGDYSYEGLESYATMSGQRFPKVDELRALLDGEPYPGIDGDCWIPCTNDDGERDWVQIGTAHEPGKSHVEHYGYPEWGDDEANQPFKQWVFCTKGVRVIKMPKKHFDLSHDALTELAAIAGARIPENDEVRAFLDGAPYHKTEDQDAWTPTTNDAGEKDWCQIGNANHEPGKSHNEHFGYPEWGDDDEPQPFKRRIVLASKVHGFSLGDIDLSWEGLKARCEAAGKRFPTNDEVRAFLDGEPAEGCDGIDSWAPSFNDAGEQDWIQIGNACHEPGKSHVEHHGYPGWGDDSEFQPFKNKMFVCRGLMAVELDGDNAKCRWKEMKARAKMAGYRLPTTGEVRSYLRGSAYEGCDGTDMWVPVKNTGDRKDEFGKKDWIQVGNANHEPGKSHVEHFGYPEWGNDTEYQPFKGWLFMAEK